ncbi:DUF817 family protein [Acuticoccus sp. I52.16.1]|uniref:DUF817 family protein n=1 Tax=Acuticoccus sp. I52.16.1 TaxID=2928472 RepID=UPI001FCFF829|nr:DUF817 family protein [Acuticoccus sp. I52.16.1]UOM33198.1 DUF817 domain-containing protein [Acuticoccus sp. I52.16.1]
MRARRRFTSVEASIDAAAHWALDRLERRAVPAAAIEFIVFGLKLAWACLFGGLMLAMILASALFAAVVVLFGRTRVHYRVFRYRLWMPLVVGFVLVALFIGFAENIGTFARAWQYPDQADGWRIVSIHKLGAWLLLMTISFVLTTVVRRPMPLDPPR